MRNHFIKSPHPSARWIAVTTACAMSMFGSHATAVTLSPHGVGQALIYPYYTVNHGQDTLLSVTNASDVGKAIKVRFREGMNGRDVLSFELLLGAHDTWTSAVSAIAQSGAKIVSKDTSCAPHALFDGVPFSPVGYNGGGEDPADAGPDGPERTREGFFELIVGGDIVPGSPTDLAIARPQNGGAPTCSDPQDLDAFVPDLQKPTHGGIYGAASIVNVTDGTFYAYNADALQGFADRVLFEEGNLNPGPTLEDASSSEIEEGGARAYVTSAEGRTVAVDYDSGIDAVSAVMMADAIYNEYVVSDALGAETDWVVTFPTKQFYVDSLYGVVPKQPFEHVFANDGAAVDYAGTVFDREQSSIEFGAGCGTICAPAPLTFEVNVLGVGHLGNGVSPVLGSTLGGAIIPAAGSAGHALLKFTLPGTNPLLPDGIAADHSGPVTLHGMPVTGFMVYNVVNANATPGILANYSGAFAHRRTVACDGCSAN